MLTSQVASSTEKKPRTIESITDEKTICGIRYVKVSWRDAPYYASTWESLHDLRKEKNYQAILRSKGLLYDEHSNKLSSLNKSGTSKKNQTNKFTSKSKSSKFKRKCKNLHDDMASHTDLYLDEDSTSVNDVRGHGAESREGFLTPIGKEPIIKFTPYLTSKNRLTTNFYRDLEEYYRKCKGDSPPSPQPPKKCLSEISTILPSQATQQSEWKETQSDLSSLV